jgi:hypothetical protein
MSNKLVDRLNKGPVICAEGFLFEIERRGYMASGEFVQWYLWIILRFLKIYTENFNTQVQM